MASESLTIHQVAERLGVTYATARRRILEGEIPASRVGRVYRVQRGDLEAFLRPGIAPEARRHRREGKDGPGLFNEDADRALRPKPAELWDEAELSLRELDPAS
jgi:excisionase family DNA binding protein